MFQIIKLFLKVRSLELNFAFLSFVGRLSIFSFLKLNEKKVIFLYNDLNAQRVIAYFYNSSKMVGIFLDVDQKKI